MEREVDSASHGQRQRAPDAAIDLHQPRAPDTTLEFDHGETSPAEFAEKKRRVLEEQRVEADRLSIRAWATAGWNLS